MEKIFKKLIVGTAIVALVVLSLVIIWPIYLSIIAGLLLAYIFYPVYKVVLRIVKEKNIASVIIVLIILFIVFIPLWFMLPLVARQLFDAYTYSQAIDISSIVGKLLPSTFSVDTSSMINSFISKIVNSVFNSFSSYLLNLPNLLFQAAIILFVFFFAMRDADKLKEYVKQISPFSPSFEKSLEKQFKDITNSVLYGNIIVGFIQGIVTGIGLFIFGVPGVLILSILAIIAAIIPVIGAWLVWIPASLYLFSQGHTGAAVGLFLYGAILVSWIDNILRPYIVSRKTNISSAVVLVGMLGGLLVFGLIGFILGPLILSYLIIILDAYKDKKLTEFFASE